jgi:predicted 3-demethylubiquinone-9 3-methyltransferase (glyoxalase superfamily)
MVMCIDSPVKHQFTFTPSFSFFVDCASEDDLRRLAAALGEGGPVLMALANYGFSRLFTWVNDRFGVSWQLNLP